MRFQCFPLGLQATVNSDLDPLLNELSRNPKFDWIKRRIQSLWPKWTDALKQLETIKPFQHSEKKVSSISQVTISFDS